jgi:hypothetical protein
MGTPVTSIVPVGYDAHVVRVFRPASSHGVDSGVTWQQIADWSGRSLHSLAQFNAMSDPVRGLTQDHHRLPTPLPSDTSTLKSVKC